MKGLLLAALLPAVATAQTFGAGLGDGGFYARPADLANYANARPGLAAYVQTGYGPATAGTGTQSLLGGPAVYGFGSMGGLPLLRCDYVGQSYRASLRGDYSLAGLAPGAVVVIMRLGGTVSQSATIANPLTGTSGAWWDADLDLSCASAGGSTAAVVASATLTFQAPNGATTAMPIGRGAGPLSVPTTKGAFTFDVLRGFTNAANQMQIETLVIEWVR